MSNNLSRARAPFDEILTQGAAAIEKMVAEHKTENYYLEFKRGLKDEKDEKENWSKALSGFGNSEGGVVIWGVQTGKRELTN